MSFPSAYFTQLRHLNRDRLGKKVDRPVAQDGGWYRMFHCTKVTLCKPGGAIERGGLKSRVDLNRGRPTASQSWIDDGEAAYITNDVTSALRQAQGGLTGLVVVLVRFGYGAVMPAARRRPRFGPNPYAAQELRRLGYGAVTLENGDKTRQWAYLTGGPT